MEIEPETKYTADTTETIFLNNNNAMNTHKRINEKKN